MVGPVMSDGVFWGVVEALWLFFMIGLGAWALFLVFALWYGADD